MLGAASHQVNSSSLGCKHQENQCRITRRSSHADENDDLRQKIGLIAALRACSRSRDLRTGRRIHANFLAQNRGDESNAHFASSLVDMYSKCGSMAEARKVFDKIVRYDQDVVLWTALILGYAENDQGEEALVLFESMQDQGFQPVGRTFVAALKACASLGGAETKGKHRNKKKEKSKSGKLMAALEKGMALHSLIIRIDAVADGFVYNSLINMYTKCGSMIDALRVFHRMKRRDVVSWNALLLGFTHNGEDEKALSFLGGMQSEGCLPDSRTFVIALKACVSLAEKEEASGDHLKMVSLEKGMSVHAQAAKFSFGAASEMILKNAMVDMYSKCGSVQDAARIFDGMKNHDVISWTTLILGFVESGDGAAALELFQHMMADGRCLPDPRTFVAALRASTNVGLSASNEEERLLALEKGMVVHRQAVKCCCDSEIYVASSLVDMYAKFGSLLEARRVFDGMRYRNVVSWNSLILGYAENGEGKAALEMFWSMDCARDSWTYVAALKACSSDADFQAGKLLHWDIYVLGLDKISMVLSCLVDFYGRCGAMTSAQQVFDSSAEMVDRGLRPNRVTFLSIFTACSQGGLVERDRIGWMRR